MTDFDSADTGALAEKPESALGGDVERDSLASDLLKQALSDRKQRYDQRKTLFRLIMLIVPGALFLTVVMMGVVIWSGGVGDAVYVAFISAMAVQSFALIATIARNLYRDESSSSKDAGPPPE